MHPLREDCLPHQSEVRALVLTGYLLLAWVVKITTTSLQGPSRTTCTRINNCTHRTSLWYYCATWRDTYFGYLRGTRSLAKILCFLFKSEICPELVSHKRLVPLIVLHRNRKHFICSKWLLVPKHLNF